MKRHRILEEGKPVRVSWDPDEPYKLIKLGPEQSEVERDHDGKRSFLPNGHLEPGD